MSLINPMQNGNNARMLILFIRTLIIYFTLVLTLRFMGKRQIGELQVSELIVTLLLSEIAVQPITDRNKPLLYAIIPIFELIAIEIIVSYLLIKVNFLKKLFYGSPTILIKRGKLQQAEMKNNRIEVDELMCELRQKGYSSLDEVYYAVLEDNGKISVFPRKAKSPPAADDCNITVNEVGIDHILVIDGHIMAERLSELGWDEDRLRREIKRCGVPLDEIFILTSDDSGKITCIKKSKG